MYSKQLHIFSLPIISKSLSFFYNIQYSFREDHSKESASLELIKRMIRELDNKRNPICMYIYIYGFIKDIQ